VASRSSPDPKLDRNLSPGGNQLGDPGYATPTPGAVPRRTQNTPSRTAGEVRRRSPHPVLPEQQGDRPTECPILRRKRTGTARRDTASPRDNSTIARPRSHSDSRSTTRRASTKPYPSRTGKAAAELEKKLGTGINSPGFTAREAPGYRAKKAGKATFASNRAR